MSSTKKLLKAEDNEHIIHCLRMLLISQLFTYDSNAAINSFQNLQ